MGISKRKISPFLITKMEIKEIGQSSLLLLIIMIIGASNARMLMSDSPPANQTAVPTAAVPTAANQTAPAQPATNQTTTNHTALRQADPSNRFSADLAELRTKLTNGKARLAKIHLAKLKKSVNRLNVADLEKALDKRIKARNSLRTSDARQNINLDPLEAYLSQLDNRLTALENGTEDGTGDDLSEKVEQLRDQMKHINMHVLASERDLTRVETKMSQMEPMWNQLRELVEKYDQSANSTFRLAQMLTRKGRF